MSVAQRSAVRWQFTPVAARGLDHPNPGSDGTTTSNASSGSPPDAPGSVRGPITSWNSQNVHGHPCVQTSGIGAGPLPRAWTKWIGMPSSVTRKLGNPLICASTVRQSNDSAQYDTNSRR